jgi:ribulose-5-phosphate 4-epimerase/fuculose-1-phosphate aldolase
MRVGTLPLIPYFAPGDAGLGDAVGRFAAKHSAVLLANHGPVVSGTSLSAAIDSIEELEETARLYLLLHGRPTRYLNEEQIADLKRRFPG